jgi:hypothetical protein
MRIALVLLVACRSPAPTPTSNTARADQPPALAGLSDDQRCEAVAARTLPCMDEVFNAESKAMTGIDWSKEPKADPAERQKLHEIRCQVGPGYTDAIVTCWHERDCQTFAACIARLDSPPLSPSP